MEWSPSAVGGVPAWSSGLLGRVPRLHHAFTGVGGNLSLRPPAGPDDAVERRRTLCVALGLDFHRLTVAEQVHGVGVAAVDDALAGAGQGRDADLCVAGADALMTDRVGVPLMALSADCPLVLVVDAARCVIGLAHAGWRSAVGGIVIALVERMVGEYGCRSAELSAAVSPSAGPCCYEVGDDVLGPLVARRGREADKFVRLDGVRRFLDLWRLNTVQLIEAGMSSERIDVAGLCSICDERFYSYRRSGPACGHAGLIAGFRRV